MENSRAKRAASEGLFVKKNNAEVVEIYGPYITKLQRLVTPVPFPRHTTKRRTSHGGAAVVC